MSADTKGAKKGTILKIISRLKPYSFLLLLSFLLAAASVVLTLYIPILIGEAIDLIVGKGQVDFAGIFIILVQVGVLVGASAFAQWLMTVINNRVAFQTVRDIRSEAFRKILVLPLRYLDSHAHGEIVSRVIADAEQFADGLLLGFAQLFTGVLTIAVTLYFLFSLSWQITLVVVLLTPLSWLIARFIADRTFHMFRLQSQIRGEQTGLINEIIGNQKVVQAFSYEKKATERFDEINERLEKATLRATFFSSLTNPTTRFVYSLVYAGVSLVGAMAVLNSGGAFTIGHLTSSLNYANQYTKPFNEISGVITELQNAFACAGRIFELIEEEPQRPDAGDAAVLDEVTGNVALEKVFFSYTPGKPLIEDLNLSVSARQRVAIVGPTGCGKTTLINLLMRFYDVDSGVIAIDGKDIRAVTRKSLRAGFGMVLQDTWLKYGTVRDNIAFGRPDATDEEIIAAAKAAYAHSFIKRLPDGYNTLISEEGGALSQGEKQLLCIARVMLTRPPMLILDEATSSIDTRTELKIQEAFQRLMEGRTSFVVAHRLSTIREADMIVVMKDGRIVEQGNHQSLLAQNGFYARLYNSQFSF